MHMNTLMYTLTCQLAMAVECVMILSGTFSKHNFLLNNENSRLTVTVL